MTLTTKDVLTQYLMGIPNDSATLLKVKYSADTIAFRLKETHQTFDFIHLLNSDDTLTCFLHECIGTLYTRFYQSLN